MLGHGFMVDPVQGIIKPPESTSHPKPPWVYVRPAMHKRCIFWHTIAFETYNLFPVGCLNCWKVVVRPRTVEELFKLLDYQQETYTGFCKCGIEVRPFVHGNYGGYFYNDSLEEGLKCYDKVKSDIARFISPEIPVILKRACTEFELKYGDSSQWEDKIKDGTWAIKDAVHDFKPLPFETLIYRLNLISNKVQTPESLVPEGCDYAQPGIVKVNVIQGWLEHAWSIGDKTAIKHNDGQYFFTPSTTYHDRDNSDMDKFKSLLTEEGKASESKV